MSACVYWIHEDALSLDHPVLRDREKTDPACFVWDPAHLESMGYSFQRLVFIYETLAEMGIDVRQGHTSTVILALASEAGVDVVRVPESPNPAIQTAVSELSDHLTVEVISAAPFVDFERPPNLRRFFSYWKSARTHLMRP